MNHRLPSSIDMASATDPAHPCGLLGDTPERDYSRKLQLFNAFAEPELRLAIAGLALKPGMRVLDAGCGTGEALKWLHDAVRPTGSVVGMDLSAAHVRVARGAAPDSVQVLQEDLTRPPLAAKSFDLIWSVNTINHLRDPSAGIGTLAGLLRPGGRIAIGQSSLLADQHFAWDARLERLTNEAVRRYYEARYGLTESDLRHVRHLLEWMHLAGLAHVTARTFIIERTAPLRPADEAYLLEAIYRGTWGERLRPYLTSEDYTELCRLCDPMHPSYALHRRDFHFIQTFTLVIGEAPARHDSSLVPT
ncbi:MAG TPA: class I SAM-dependent methyltransferase [Steroidobacteraceae bacterium]|jgi:SAM-dependent methyltransferase